MNDEDIMAYRFYVSVKGKDQGPFKDEDGAGKGRMLGHRFRFKGSSNNDPATRAKGAAARSHEPLLLTKPWGASSPLFFQAFWTNEVLEEVTLTFVHRDDDGKEKPFHEIVMTNATIVSLEHVAGDDVTVPDGIPQELEEIGFRFEAMTIKNIPAQTAANFDFKNEAA